MYNPNEKNVFQLMNGHNCIYLIWLWFFQDILERITNGVLKKWWMNQGDIADITVYYSAVVD